MCVLHGTSLLLIKPKIEDQFSPADREAKGCLYPITYALRYTTSERQESERNDPSQSLLLTQRAQISEARWCLKAPLILRESMKINFKKTVSA